jgi:phosphoribosylanthranilate isomerase
MCQLNGLLYSSKINIYVSCRTLRARPATASFVANSAGNAEQSRRYVKVCGVTNVEDALLAVSSGANLIGMILWPKAKRSIRPSTAKEIAKIAREHGASPVAVFVDEDAATICRVCEESDVDIAQLHGDGARSALADLPPSIKTVYVMHADMAGVVQTALPHIDVDWVLLDSLQGGSGERFDWSSLNPPRGRSGWLLAGGLTPENVAEAINTANPTGVDVSSGVCGPDGLKKDAAKVQQYVAEARGAYQL